MIHLIYPKYLGVNMQRKVHLVPFHPSLKGRLHFLNYSPSGMFRKRLTLMLRGHRTDSARILFDRLQEGQQERNEIRGSNGIPLPPFHGEG